MCFPIFNVACHNCNYHNSISIVVYEVLLTNIVTFKLSTLNQHRLITGYSNRHHAIPALI